MVEKEKLPFLDDEVGEEIARKMIASMNARVQDRLKPKPPAVEPQVAASAEAPKGVSPDATANIDAQLAGGKNISGRRAAKRAAQVEKPGSSEPPKKKKSHAREIVEFKDEVSAISKRKTEWVEKIEKVTTRDELSAITKEARKNGSSGKMPYFFLGKFLDGLLEKYADYSDDMRNELKEAASKAQEEVAGAYLMKKAELDSKKVAASAIDPVMLPDIELPLSSKKEIPTGKKDWTVKELLPYIANDEEFSILDTKGKAVKYRRDGDKFLTADKKPKNADKAVLRVLNHGGTLKRAEDATLVPAGPDASTAAEKKGEDFFLTEENVPTLFVGNNNSVAHHWNTIIRKGKEYFFVSPNGEIQTHPHTEEQIQNLVKKEEWERVTDDTEYKKAFGLLSKDPVVEGGVATLSPEEEALLPVLVTALQEERDRQMAAIEAATSPFELELHKPLSESPFMKFLNDLQGKHSDSLSKEIRKQGVPWAIDILEAANARWIELQAGNKGKKPLPEPGEGVEGYQFDRLPEGKVAYFMAGSNTVTVEREGELYRIMGHDMTVNYGFHYDLEYVQNLAKEEGWVEVRTTLDPADLRTMPGAEPGLAIAELEAKVEEMRLQFATIDYKEAPLWKKLKGIFGKHVDEATSLDRESCRQSYEHALTELQEARLEELRQQGLTGKELKEAMAGLLRYFKYDERVELYNIRTQVRLEDPSKNYGVKAVEFFETIGREYNKLSKWKKAAIAVGCFAGAGALALGGGVVGATAAGGVLMARRAITGLGAGVALDTLLEGTSEGVKKWSANFEGKSEAQIFGIEEEDGKLSAYDLEELDNILKKDIRALDKKFKRQKVEALLRKTVALGVGVGIGSGYFGSILAEKAGLSGGAQSGSGASGGQGAGAPRVEAPRPGASAATGAASGAQPSASAAAAPASAAEAATTPASGASAPQGVDQGQIKAVPAEDTGAKPGAAPEETEKPKAQVEGKPDAADSEKLEQEPLRDHKVTAADSKKGLWGVLEKRFLPADISKPEGNRVVQSLENLIQQKLDGMTPEARAEAGFPTGRIDMIQRGGVIRFDELLSEQEIQEVIDGKDIPAPQTITMEPASVEGGVDAPLESPTPTTPDATDTRTEAPGDTPGDTLKDTPERMKGLPSQELEDSSTDIPEEPKTVAEFDAQRQLSNPKEFLIEHPELKGKLFETVGKVRQGIFVLSPRLDGVLPEQDYLSNREKLGGMRVTQVLKDLGNPSGVNHELNPLHDNQMKALNKFVNAAEKSFGPVISQPGAGENIDSYTSRMATMAVRTGKAIRGFYKP